MFHSKSITQNYLESHEPETYTIQEYSGNGLGEKLSFHLIRPPRFTYHEDMLLPKTKKLRVLDYEELEIPFKLSLYKNDETKYIILYLHGNSASRVEGSLLLKYLPAGVGFACFDFSACGNRNDKEYVTLGKDQSKEVDIAARYLKNLGYVVAGWGRSMGAVSLLLSKQCEVLVVDSPYSSLKRVCRQSTQKQVPTACCCFFKCIYPCAFGWVKSIVEEKSGLNIDEMEIIELMKKESMNKRRKIFFIAGKDDTLVSCQHTKDLHKNFEGIKKLRIFEGTHNSPRPRHLILECFDFINHHVQLGNPEELNSPSKISKTSSSPRLVKIKAQMKPLKTETGQLRLKPVGNGKDQSEDESNPDQQMDKYQDKKNGETSRGELNLQLHRMLSRITEKGELSEASPRKKPSGRPNNFGS